MELKTSVAAILFPQARHSLKGMEQTAAYLSGKVDMLEFFYEGGDDLAVGRLLERSGLQGVFIGVIPLKERGLNLCSQDEENRQAAVSLMKECVDRARATGCHALMVCSGKHPKGPSEIPACADAFVKSICEIAEYEVCSSRDYRIKLLLEPCDSKMDACHLLGGTSLTIELTKRILESHSHFGLTMDTAHVAEEGEVFLDAMQLARPYCHHVHFANCVVKNKADPFYGDKHVGFDYPGSEFPYPVLEQIFGQLKELYRNSHLSVAIEILCRAANPYQNFEAIMANMPWFFAK